jgi:hypothetical protein
MNQEVKPHLLPCPFCGGPAQMELAHVTRDPLYGDKRGDRRWYGVTCRNTINHGLTCCMEQVPSASIEAAAKRWNMRNGVATDKRAAVAETLLLEVEQIAETGEFHTDLRVTWLEQYWAEQWANKAKEARG